MKVDRKLLNEILQARESRVAIQREIISEYNLPLISITLNIPGSKKDSLKIRKIYRECIRVVKIKLLKQRESTIVYERERLSAEGPEFFVVVDGFAAKTLKKMFIQVENEHPLGRLFDIDVISKDFSLVSRKDVNVPLRKCIICEDAAINCISMRKHKRDEIIKTVDNLIDQFLIF